MPPFFRRSPDGGRILPVKRLHEGLDVSLANKVTGHITFPLFCQQFPLFDTTQTFNLKQGAKLATKFLLLEFEKPVTCSETSPVVGSRLDTVITLVKPPLLVKSRVARVLSIPYPYFINNFFCCSYNLPKRLALF